jgi:hypothetical protein
MKDIQSGDYIVNKDMQMEGIVVSLRKHANPHKPNTATLFCTRDEIYSLNVGQTIELKLHESWKINNNRKFR